MADEQAKEQGVAVNNLTTSIFSFLPEMSVGNESIDADHKAFSSLQNYYTTP